MSGQVQEMQHIKDLSPLLEVHLNRLVVLGMACEAIENVDHKNAFSVGLHEARLVVEDMIEALRQVPRTEIA